MFSKNMKKVKWISLLSILGIAVIFLIYTMRFHHGQNTPEKVVVTATIHDNTIESKNFNNDTDFSVDAAKLPLRTMVFCTLDPYLK